LQKTVEKYAGKLKMILLVQDSLKELKMQLRISGTPTFMLLRKGKEVNRILGVVDEEELAHFLDEYVSAE